MIPILHLLDIVEHNERIKRDQRDLARLQAMPPEQAKAELMHRQVVAIERLANTRPVINIKTSVF